MQSSPDKYYVIFTAVTAIGILLQALVLVGIFIAVRKVMAKLLVMTDEVKEQTLPLIATARNLAEDVAPKLKVASSNLAEMSHTLRDQADQVNETVESLLQRTDAQVRRVDEMVTGVFNTVDHASRTIETAVAAPVRRFSGILNGVKTGVGVYLDRKKQSSPDEAAGTEESEQKPA
jgi:methyl-accepting chemotaxis protein